MPFKAFSISSSRKRCVDSCVDEETELKSLRFSSEMELDPKPEQLEKKSQRESRTDKTPRGVYQRLRANDNVQFIFALKSVLWL